MHSVRKAQRAKLLQKELGMLFLTEAASLFGNALISVTAVDIGRGSSLAKVYLSFSLQEDHTLLWQKVIHQKDTIRRLLGKRIAHKMHKIPDLKFYIDHTVIQGARVTVLIDQLDLPV